MTHSLKEALPNYKTLLSDGNNATFFGLAPSELSKEDLIVWLAYQKNYYTEEATRKAKAQKFYDDLKTKLGGGSSLFPSV